MSNKAKRYGDKTSKSNRRATREEKIREEAPYEVREPTRQPKTIYCKTDNHRQYLQHLETKELVLGTGCSGTGKTYMAGAWAANQLLLKTYDRVILSRPAVKAGGDKLGFLPGTLEEKYEPYLRAVKEVLAERLGAGTLEYYLKTGAVEGIPVEDMRSLSFHNSIIILDEAQNTTPEQQYLVASRVGKGSKIVICGDYKRQKDISGYSGLADLLEVIGHMPEVGVTEFTPEDIVRSGLAKKIITAYYERG